MRQVKSIHILLVFLLTSCFVRAAPADLVLSIDAAAHVSIINTGTTAFNFDGYSILCNDACLNPAGWNSIEDQVASAPLAIFTKLSAGGLGFAEAAPTTSQLTELTVGSGAVLQPRATLDLGLPISGSIGDIITRVNSGALRWQWTSPTFGTNSNATISAVPEPSAAVGLAAVACLVCLGRRHRVHGGRTTC